MSLRIESIDDCDVQYMYEVEGKTQKEIAEYYGVSRGCIYGRLHIEETKVSSKKYRLKNPEYDRERRLKNPGYAKEHSKQWRLEHPDYNKQWNLEHPEYHKEYYQEHSEELNETSRKFLLEHPEYKKEWWQTDKGKALMRSHNANRRSLGSIELNIPFPNSEGHHIDETYIIHIPKEIHRNIYHNLKTGEGMQDINAIAFGYITEETFDKLEAGEI